MNTIKAVKLALALAGLGLSLSACATEGDDMTGDESECVGAKCDDPSTRDPELQRQQCLDRQSEVLDSSNNAFTMDAIRWSCADVEGVNTVGRDSRGQEYCEYFALFQPPPAVSAEDLEEGEELVRPDAVDLGRPFPSGDVTDLTVCVDEDGDGQDDDGRSGECRTTLNEEQLFNLEDHPDEDVGACVFTSWHSDNDFPIINCQDGAGGEKCPEEAQIFGFPFTIENFMMKSSINSNGAAQDLVARCFAEPTDDVLPNRYEHMDVIPDDWSDESNPETEPFFRGCMESQGLFATGWRRSDPAVCAVANRLRECGCGVPGVTNSLELGAAVVPTQPRDGSSDLRGFKLGTWDDAKGLPPGCRYADTGETSQFLVFCDLTAADVLGSLNDPKETCRATYGANVVVHVPIPAAAISCEPSGEGEGAGCGAAPWVIGNEGTTEEPEEPEEPEDLLGNCCVDGRGELEDGGNRTGCENSTVQDAVCAADGWCCSNAWDDICVGQVKSIAGRDCPSGE